jgi:hypothetical protein
MCVDERVDGEVELKGKKKVQANRVQQENCHLALKE